MIIATGRAGLPKIELKTDRLLLVEGKDEENLLGKLIEDCLNDDGQDIQIVAVGSKSKFRSSLIAIKVAAQARPTLRSIGVIRDADDNPNGSFDSVCGSLRSAGYEPPAAHAEFSDATPSIGVFIVPDGSQPGAIETLCRRSVEGKAATECVDEYMECLKTRKGLQSKNADKTFTHAYLAAMRDPVARVGEGAQQGVWDFQSPAFDDLSQFVRDLAS